MVPIMMHRTPFLLSPKYRMQTLFRRIVSAQHTGGTQRGAALLAGSGRSSPKQPTGIEGADAPKRRRKLSSSSMTSPASDNTAITEELVRLREQVKHHDTLYHAKGAPEIRFGRG